MLVQHNPCSFLTGDSPFLPSVRLETSPQMVVEELVFEQRHEGFIGIPHGGLAMGLCLDAWRRIGQPHYPVTVRFRFGGSGISIGEASEFIVERLQDQGEPAILARITKPGDKTPYLRADITPANSAAVASLPLCSLPSNGFRDLPYYRNCFVCGHHREEPGLQRRFRVHGCDNGWFTSVQWGRGSEDEDRAGFFLIGAEELHPAVLVSIFDENTAWAGFMQTRTCGLSVRLEFTLLRPVKRTEPLVFVGRPSGTRGNPRAPRFFLAEGAVFSMADPANPEPVAAGKGEWVVMDQYTQQIKANLLPNHDWEWIFG
jgi:hypothetical protein